MDVECDRCGRSPHGDDWKDEWVVMDAVAVCGACTSLEERVEILEGMEQILAGVEALAASGECEPPDDRFVDMVVRERARVQTQVDTARALEWIGAVR